MCMGGNGVYLGLGGDGGLGVGGRGSRGGEDPRFLLYEYWAVCGGVFVCVLAVVLWVGSMKMILVKAVVDSGLFGSAGVW